MPKTKIVKPTKVPRHEEPFVVEIPDEESYSDLIGRTPYTYVPNLRIQNVAAMMLLEQHHKKRKFVVLYFPTSLFAQSYIDNPPLLAAIIRRQKNVPFQYVTARHEKLTNRMRITGTHEKREKRNSFVHMVIHSMLAEHQKKVDTNRPDDSFNVIVPYQGMPQSYQNNQYIFRQRIQQALRQETKKPNMRLALQLTPNGYRLTRIPVELENS